MSTTYRMCKILIERGRTDGMAAKLNAFLLADQITVDEYNELIGMLAA